MSLNNLAVLAPTEHTLAVYSQAEGSLSAHPTAARQITVQRAQFQIAHGDPASGIHTLVDLLQQVPEDLGPVVLAVRDALRDVAHTTETGAAQVRTEWQTATGAVPPAWLDLPQAAFELAIIWFQCPTWAESRAFWDAHEHQLRSPEFALALEELALAHEVAEQHLRIAQAATTNTPDAAFRPYVTGELLSTWLECPSWEESQAYLTDHAEELLHQQATELLATINKSAKAAVHHSLVLLARADGIPTAYTYAAKRLALNERIQTLLTTPDPELLESCALLELLVHQDQFTGTVHLAMSAILANAPYDSLLPFPDPTPSDKDRALTEITTLISRSPQHAPALGTLLHSLLTTPTSQ
ncbi:hypothetical protein [Streptomyces sp. NPDC003832]